MAREIGAEIGASYYSACKEKGMPGSICTHITIDTTIVMPQDPTVTLTTSCRSMQATSRATAGHLGGREGVCDLTRSTAWCGTSTWTVGVIYILTRTHARAHTTPIPSTGVYRPTVWRHRQATELLPDQAEGLRTLFRHILSLSAHYFATC